MYHKCRTEPTRSTALGLRDNFLAMGIISESAYHIIPTCNLPPAAMKSLHHTGAKCGPVPSEKVADPSVVDRYFLATVGRARIPTAHVPGELV